MIFYRAATLSCLQTLCPNLISGFSESCPLPEFPMNFSSGTDEHTHQIENKQQPPGFHGFP